MTKHITAPLTKAVAATLRAGESITLSGTVYTARDAAHKRLCALVAAGESLPFPIEGAVLYYVGPSPARPGQPIGSAGPTTSYRMDAYAPTLLDLGALGMIGKGKRSEQVIASMQKNGAVYFGAIGGAGALLSQCVKSAELICYEDLGAEAIRKLEVENLPLTVIIDSLGTNLYETGRASYLVQRNAQNE